MQRAGDPQECAGGRTTVQSDDACVRHYCRDPPAGCDVQCFTGGHVTGAEQVYIVRVPVFWVRPLLSTLTIGSPSLVQVIAPSVPWPNA